nr:biotin/lipoyl-containing protein [uncultured Dethiosulfovibrio sp.]
MSDKYRVTVNGTAYDVEVESLGAGEQGAAPVVAAPSAPASAPAPKPAAPAPKAAPAPAPAAGGESVTAPMPGKVLRVIASQGTSVSAGDVILILEAMKMENEIVAPCGGTITQMAAKEGATVNSGDVLAVIG